MIWGTKYSPFLNKKTEMNWKRYLVACGIIGVLMLVIVLITYTSPCRSDGLLIGACGLGKFVMYWGTGLLMVNFIVVSLLFLKPWKPATNSLKKVIMLSLISLVFAGAFVIPAAGILQSLRGVVLTLQDKRYKTEVLRNFSITNFTERPVINSQTGKFDGIRVSFDLTVSRDDLYFGIVEITPYFGNYLDNRFDERLRSNSPKTYAFTLKPTKDFYEKKPDGPYVVTIDVGTKGQKKWRGGWRDFNILITGDETIENKLDTPLLKDEKLVTRPYRFSDFQRSSQKDHKNYGDEIFYTVRQKGEAILEVTDPELELPEDVHAKQVQRFYKVGEYFLALVQQPSVNVQLNLPEDFTVSFVGVMFARKEDGHWSKWFAIEDKDTTSKNNPAYMWMENLWPYIGIVDQNGANGKGIMKTFVFDGTSFQRAGCYDYDNSVVGSMWGNAYVLRDTGVKVLYGDQCQNVLIRKTFVQEK